MDYDRPLRQIVLALLLGAAILGALWYFQVYDTAAGKCQRGDLNACMVWQAQQGQQVP